MLSVQVDQVSHRYGKRLALNQLSLDVRAGEVFGMLGPNGSGKTTLFHLLSTLLPLQEGRVIFSGKDLTLDLAAQRDSVRRHIAVVFQNPGLDKQLTSDENLRHHGHLYGLRGIELEQRITESLGRFGLLERRRDYAGKLSGGMRRRVELAKALLTRPELLLLDEPSTGLDPGARIDLWDALLDVQRRDGVTILLTTHLMDEAERCDRLAILNHGKLLALGTPAELRAQVGGEVLTLSSRQPEQLQQALREKFSLECDRMDTTLRIELPDAHQRVPQLVEGLHGMIDSVSIGKPTLEDVFIHLTGHRFVDEEEAGTEHALPRQ